MFRLPLNLIVVVLTAATFVLPGIGVCRDDLRVHSQPVNDEVVAGGRALFEQLWSVAPSAFGRWGRGPTANGEACGDCHANAGRGRPPESATEPLRQGVLRLSVGSADHPVPNPAYGEQLQYEGVLGKVPAEGEVRIEWREHTEQFGDGTPIRLRRPVIHVAALAFGPISAPAMMSLRIAPALQGIGLLEGVPGTVLQQIAAEQRAVGLAGRINRLTDADGRIEEGRFGLKSNQSTLIGQIAAALHEDLGVTSPLHPEENCPKAQHACRAMAVGTRPEIDESELAAIAAYLRALPPPERRTSDDDRVLRGESLFALTGCAHCHRPSLPLQASGEESPASVQAYTDLLIHDLGEALADGRPDATAGGRDWRTAPLWGLSEAGSALLHDGRARSIEEAILWHGGEAFPAREGFRSMRKSDRDALVSFLRTL